MAGYIGKGQPVSIDDNAVETVDIVDDAVTNAKIATNAVTGDSIAANAVGNSEMSDNAIGNAEMADDAVGVAELSATGTPSNTTFLRGDNAWATAGSTSASDLTSGTLPDARFPSTLPAISGANLTGLTAGGPSLGTASVIRTNAQTISENITIGSTTNGMSAGPITIADGYTVTVNGNWSVV
jgi:hypothetical protein